MFKAVGITDNCWILYNHSIKNGLLILNDKNQYELIGGSYAGIYNDLTELEKGVGDKIKFEKTNRKRIDPVEIDGYPTKHTNVFDIDTTTELKTYTKKQGSDIKYAAGYFCIQFKGKWQSSFCPKIKTLNDHPHLGPFKTKAEMDHMIKIENSKLGV